MAKLELDSQKCQRHGQCAGAAPELLQFQDDGSMKVVLDVLTGDLLEAAEDACEMCPEDALRIRPAPSPQPS